MLAARNSAAPPASWSMPATRKSWPGRHSAKTNWCRHSNKANRCQSTTTNWWRAKLDRQIISPNPNWLRWWRSTALVRTPLFRCISTTFASAITCESRPVAVWCRPHWATYSFMATRKSIRNWCCPPCDRTWRNCSIWLPPVRLILAPYCYMRWRFSDWNSSFSCWTLQRWIRCLSRRFHRWPNRARRSRGAASADGTWSIFRQNHSDCIVHSAMKRIRCRWMAPCGKLPLPTPTIRSLEFKFKKIILHNFPELIRNCVARWTTSSCCHSPAAPKANHTPSARSATTTHRSRVCPAMQDAIRAHIQRARTRWPCSVCRIVMNANAVCWYWIVHRHRRNGSSAAMHAMWSLIFSRAPPRCRWLKVSSPS